MSSLSSLDGPGPAVTHAPAEPPGRGRARPGSGGETPTRPTFPRYDRRSKQHKRWERLPDEAKVMAGRLAWLENRLGEREFRRVLAEIIELCGWGKLSESEGGSHERG